MPDQPSPKPSNQDQEKTQVEGPNMPKLPKIIHFEELAVCGEEVWIENNGELYRLRRTRQGKLILTK